MNFSGVDSMSNGEVVKSASYTRVLVSIGLRWQSFQAMQCGDIVLPRLICHIAPGVTPQHGVSLKHSECLHHLPFFSHNHIVPSALSAWFQTVA